jgi:transposase
VFLPSGSPHLNPVEQVWKQLKRTMSPIIVQDEEEFHALVKDVYERITRRVSYAKKWAKEFLDFRKLL